MAEKIYIGGELESVATGNKVADVANIKDKTQGDKSQAEINAETQEALAGRYTKEETYNKTELDSLITTPQVNYESVTATAQTTAVTDVLPATGEADTIYRVGSWDGTQYDATCYSEYAWKGDAYIHLSTKPQIGEVFDISAYRATGGTLAKYADLAAALDGGNNIPQSLRKGGMSVKFVQSSDNKYVQYRLMADTFSTTEADWQGVDDEPTVGSDNLVKSGGVASKVYSIPFNLNGLYLQSGKFSPNQYWRATGLFSVSVGDVINVRQRVNQGDISVFFFDENKRLLPSSPLADNGNWSERTCVVPENAFYAAVCSLTASDETMFAVSSANIIRLFSDAILAVQKESFSLINKVLQVIPPVLGDDWSIYSQNVTNNFLYANRQSEVVRVSGIRFKFYSETNSINTIRVYLMDITDTSSFTLLKEITDASEVDICYFDTPILVGGNKQIFVAGNGATYKNQTNSGLVYAYDIEQDALSSNNQVCMGYELILNATISERISAFENTKNNIIIDNNDLIVGFWYRDSLQTAGVYNNLRTHRNAIPTQDCLITYSGSNADKAVWGFSLYDSSMNPLGNYPQNKPFYGGSIAIRMREILFFHPTAAYFRVNLGIMDNGSFLPIPSDAKMNVQKAEYKPIIIVDKNGLGDYLTITDAVMNAFDNLDTPVEIFIHNGIYNEFIKVGENRYLSFKGENKHLTIMESHTGQYVDAPIWIDGDFTIENMTLKMLDDNAPADWTPGNSQTDRQTMLPGYALHVDGGNGEFPPLNGEYKLGVVKNCILYSVANAAMGCGLHGNNKVIFENCDFVRNVSNDDYLTYTSDYGAFLVHDALAGEVEENQRLVMLYCRYISNLNSAAKLDMSHSIDTSNVEIQAIGNSFYAGASDDNAIVFVRNNSVLHKISNQNNNALLNS